MWLPQLELTLSYAPWPRTSDKQLFPPGTIQFNDICLIKVLKSISLSQSCLHFVACVQVCILWWKITKWGAALQGSHEATFLLVHKLMNNWGCLKSGNCQKNVGGEPWDWNRSMTWCDLVQGFSDNNVQVQLILITKLELSGSNQVHGMTKSKLSPWSTVQLEIIAWITVQCVGGWVPNGYCKKYWRILIWWFVKADCQTSKLSSSMVIIFPLKHKEILTHQHCYSQQHTTSAVSST